MHPQDTHSLLLLLLGDGGLLGLLGSRRSDVLPPQQEGFIPQILQIVAGHFRGELCPIAGEDELLLGVEAYTDPAPRLVEGDVVARKQEVVAGAEATTGREGPRAMGQ